MSGVSALSAARGGMPAARGSMDPVSHDATQVDVVEYVDILENSAGESIWAVEAGWDFERLRSLDCFALDYDDPTLLEILDAERFESRHAEQPFSCPNVADSGDFEHDIVKIILETEWPRDNFGLFKRSDDLLVDLINLQRSRW